MDTKRFDNAVSRARIALSQFVHVAHAVKSGAQPVKTTPATSAKTTPAAGIVVGLLEREVQAHVKPRVVGDVWDALRNRLKSGGAK